MLIGGGPLQSFKRGVSLEFPSAEVKAMRLLLEARSHSLT